MILKKLYITLTLFTFLLGQDIGTDWIDVRGKTNDQIKKTISDEIKNLKIYPPEKISTEQEKLSGENEDRKYDFNSTKIINWFYDLNFENALNDPRDTAMEFFKKFRNIEDP